MQSANATARVRAVSAKAPTDGESALARPGLPVVVLAAAVLAAEQVSGLLVGSAALWLHGEPVSVGGRTQLQTGRLRVAHRTDLTGPVEDQQ